MESLTGHAQLTGIAIVALAALGCGLVMRRFKQPALVGYILAGVILGPSGFALVQDRGQIQTLAELGVLMLLFLIGMEMSLRGFRAVWRIALVTTVVQIAAALGVMFILGALLDWPLGQVLLLAFVAAISSTAVAIKMLEDIGELRTPVGRNTVGILIAQDLAVVPMMLIIGNFGAEAQFSLWSLASILLSIGFLGLLIVYLSRRKRLVLPFAEVVARSVDLTPLAGLAFCFAAAALTGLLGLSAAYGAFLAGLVIGNSTSRGVMIRHTNPIQSILLMLFFLSIGLLLDLDFTWSNIWTVLGIVLFILVFKTALNVIVIRLLGETWPRSILSGVLLAQIGEFSFIMAALGMSVGAVSPEIHRLIISVTVLSLAVSPFWLELARRLHRVSLLGITSGREAIRLTLGREGAGLIRSTQRAEDRMVEMASGATRWMGDIMPRSRRPSDGPSHGATPGLGLPPPSRRKRR